MEQKETQDNTKEEHKRMYKQISINAELHVLLKKQAENDDMTMCMELSFLIDSYDTVNCYKTGKVDMPIFKNKYAKKPVRILRESMPKLKRLAKARNRNVNQMVEVITNDYFNNTTGENK